MTLGIHEEEKETFFQAKITKPSAFMVYPNGQILTIGTSKDEPQKRANMRGKLHGFADAAERIEDTTVSAEILINSEFDHYLLCGLDLKVYRHGTTNKVYFGHSPDLKWGSELYERTLPEEEFLLPNLRKQEPYEKEDIFDLYESLRPVLRRVRRHRHGANEPDQREQLEKIIIYTIGKECIGLPLQINHKTHQQYKEERIAQVNRQRVINKENRRKRKEQRKTRRAVLYAAMVSAAVSLMTAGANVCYEQSQKEYQREPPVQAGYDEAYAEPINFPRTPYIEEEKTEPLFIAFNKKFYNSCDPEELRLNERINLDPYPGSSCFYSKEEEQKERGFIDDNDKRFDQTINQEFLSPLRKEK